MFELYIKILTLSQKVCINVVDALMQATATKMMQALQVDLTKVQFFIHPTNDAWCRDHGPSFLIGNKSMANLVNTLIISQELI